MEEGRTVASRAAELHFLRAHRLFAEPTGSPCFLVGRGFRTAPGMDSPSPSCSDDVKRMCARGFLSGFEMNAGHFTLREQGSPPFVMNCSETHQFYVRPAFLDSPRSAAAIRRISGQRVRAAKYGILNMVSVRKNLCRGSQTNLNSHSAPTI